MHIGKHDELKLSDLNSLAKVARERTATQTQRKQKEEQLENLSDFKSMKIYEITVLRH